MERRDEFALISYLASRQPSGGPRGSAIERRIRTGIGDDAAIVSARDQFDWVVCCDMMVEDIHFKRNTMKPFDIGYKALASNVSDIAAMGGLPLFYLVSLGVSSGWSEQELGEMYSGMAALAEAFGMKLIGGDTSASPGGLTVSITAMGEVESGRTLLRSQAKPGDLVFLTGTVGDSAAGLGYLLEQDCFPSHVPEAVQPLVERHCRPYPQVQAGRLLASLGIRAALNDISDGLASEAWEIAEASSVRMVLDRQSIPLSVPARVYAESKAQDVLHWALYGGEDYQLIGCLSADEKSEMDRIFREAGLPLYWIGFVEQLAADNQAPQVEMRHSDGSRSALAKKGYNHFKESYGEEA
ncbi:thiamine-phosphate kinase [Aneurinibacillus sp. Ricciae_BoGa-3]|uniref:thiamine-phosphate kinase n=1 Tax=Aneurinibacillus sp. Ricciae_BoGa-3 TaxID=3022697 RepID=UPI00233FE2F6|nr:thiamine-phosphate kinase [Aneurinibacillus sp. Ricciae_BoGa-3]WCK54997.1 thiamine-phosphate kinase [Aneurinibacillus sp. Ricciae_BoGa-3]